MGVNGQRPGSNNYTVDGIDNRESTVSSIILYTPVDAIQEFKVQTGNQEAEFGTNPGATVNVIVRSGTNELHGSAYEFLRNNDLDAKNFFDRKTSPIPSFKMNQYGATLGGPIVRNKTFVFGYYDGETIHNFIYNPERQSSSNGFGVRVDHQFREKGQSIRTIHPAEFFAR